MLPCISFLKYSSFLSCFDKGASNDPMECIAPYKTTILLLLLAVVVSIIIQQQLTTNSKQSIFHTQHQCSSSSLYLHDSSSVNVWISQAQVIFCLGFWLVVWENAWMTNDMLLCVSCNCHTLAARRYSKPQN